MMSFGPITEVFGFKKIIGSSGTAEAKKVALEAAGVKVGKTPSETANLLRAVLNATKG